MKYHIAKESDGKKTKILIGITKATAGGAQRYVFDLATHLSQERHDILVVSGEPGILIEHLSAANIRTVVIPNLGRDIAFGKDWHSFLKLKEIIQAEKPDILHLNSPKMAGLGALAGRISGVPRIIVTVHGWYFYEQRHFLWKAAVLFFSWLTTVLAHQTILITQRDLSVAKRFPFIPKSRLKLIPNGINSSSSPLAKDIARLEILKHLGSILPEEKLASLKEPIWIGTIAELHQNKDLPTLIRAVAGLENHSPLIIVGDGEEKETLEKLVAELDISHKIVFTGFVANAAALATAFDIFCLSSTKEGLPYTLLEAGLSGCALVGTNVGGIPDIIENKKNGLLVPPKNPNAMRDAIQRMQSDTDFRKYCQTNIASTIRQNFSLERMMRETINLYH